MQPERNQGMNESVLGDGPVRILVLTNDMSDEKMSEMLHSVSDALPNIQLVTMQKADLERMKEFITTQQTPFTAVIDTTQTHIKSVGGHGIMYRVSLERALGQQRAQAAEESNDEFSAWFSNHTNEPLIYLNPGSESSSADLQSLLTYYNGR